MPLPPPDYFHASFLYDFLQREPPFRLIFIFSFDIIFAFIFDIAFLRIESTFSSIFCLLFSSSSFDIMSCRYAYRLLPPRAAAFAAAAGYYGCLPPFFSD
jgi:hypothetical protein